jgi:hypothetical protein
MLGQRFPECGPRPGTGSWKKIPVLRKYKNIRMILLISRNNHERGKTPLAVNSRRQARFVHFRVT